MWQTNTHWFMVALVLGIFAVGGVLFGRFEQHKSRGRRVLKQVLVVTLFALVEVYAGRSWALGLLAVFGVAALYIHAWWLPRHGINGLTAEPYDEYLALVKRTPRRGSS